MEQRYAWQTLGWQRLSATRQISDGESTRFIHSIKAHHDSGSTFYLSPECQGGLFEKLESYNTATNDLWSLGVILVNLTCGRNPWRQACPSDETFRAFVHNPEFLRTILPISHATNNILKGLFNLEPRKRPSLAELRRQILAVDTFTMTEEELKTAHSAARAAAAAVRPIPPTVAPVVIPQQSLLQEIDVDQHHIYDAQPTDRQPWSGSSGVYIDESIMNQIDFSEPPARNHPPVSAVGVPAAPPPTVPIHIEAFDSETYSLLATSSQSSSSGDGDISLPPTPEFNPADKLDHGVAQVGGKVWSDNLGNINRDMLHVDIVNSLSPVPAEFRLN